MRSHIDTDDDGDDDDGDDDDDDDDDKNHNNDSNNAWYMRITLINDNNFMMVPVRITMMAT